MDVGFGGGRHLAALNVADATLGVQDEDVDGIQPAEGLDGSSARIARGGADDRGALPRRRSARFMNRETTCMARSLKASVGP